MIITIPQKNNSGLIDIVNISLLEYKDFFINL